MSLSAENPAQQYLNLRDKNLAFFRQFYPGIYDFFASYQMQQAKLDILPEQNELDLLIDGKHLYGGKSRAYAKQEVATFLSHNDVGDRIKTIQPLTVESYKNQRLFARSIKSVYQKSPPLQSGFLLDGFFPLVVFMGVGLGHHISILNTVRSVEHIVIVETDMDRFAASLYCVDWQQIVGDRLNSDDSTISFVLLPGVSDPGVIQSLLWNQLIKFTPHFPVATIFYNHLGDRVFDAVTDIINRDLYVHLYSFGNWDDEVNQLNNFLLNCRQGTKKLPRPSEVLANKVQLPVCIVGSGPSLDDRIEDLKKLSGFSLVISCGTALRALYAHGLKPDIHVELESDFATYKTQNMMDDKAFMQSVSVVGAAQLNPLTFSLFGEKRMFFKSDGLLAGMFGGESDAINGAAPTCTNAAIAIAHHYGFKTIYLFGLDYGFPDKTQHHAKGTLYYKVDQAEGIDEERVYPDHDLLIVPAADGGKVKTSTFLYASKRRTEDVLALAAKESKFYNCSNGAALATTKWVDSDGLARLVADYSEQKLMPEKTGFLEKLFDKGGERVPDVVLENGISRLSETLDTFVQQLLTLLEEQTPDLSALSRLCARMSMILENSYLKNNPAFYFFIRGTVWHFLLAGFSLAMAAEDKNNRRIFIRKWKSEFADFLRVTSQELSQVTSMKSGLEDNALIHKSIVEADRDFRPIPFQGDLSKCDWRFEELMIDDRGAITTYVW